MEPTKTPTLPSTNAGFQFADILSDLGVRIKKVGEKEIQGYCPVHHRTVGHVDNHPSWSMNAESGLWLCFSCGARGTLSMLVDELSGGSVDSFGVQRLLVEHGLNRLFTPPSSPQEKQLDTSDFFSFVRVSDARCFHRNLDPDLVFSHGVRWNPVNKAWAIPIFHISGVLQGWQEKKIGSVRNYPVGVEKGSTLFGIERFRSKTVVLVESPLDVIRFSGVFKTPQAVASFGAHVSNQQMRLLTSIADTVVIALDNDKAGKEANKILFKRLANPRKGIRWWNYGGTDAKDIGDMTDTEIEHGYLNSSVIPPWIL